MIDIHCHILHEVDDGAKDLAESLAMARIAYNDGVHHIVATPHFNRNWRSDRALVDRRLEQLQQVLERERIGITVHRGNEVTLENGAWFHEHHSAQSFYHLAGGSSFLLMEQPWTHYCPDTLAVVLHLLDGGVTPIIPHPERHTFFRAQPELLDALIDAGVWTQVTADNLLGRNNEEARAFALRMLERGQVHTIATDAHNVNRKPNLSEGFRIVEEHAGKAAAAAILGRMKQVIGL